jgi:MFS family permease
MDGFNKMAEPAGTARVIDVNKSDGRMEPYGLFRIKLAVHTLMTGLVALMPAIVYLGKDDDDTVNTLDTLLATLCVVGLANFLLSLLNLVSEMFFAAAPFYDKLRNRVLNSARNTMTSLSLVIGGIVFGMQTDEFMWVTIIAVGFVRLLDCALDIGGNFGEEIQCPGDEDKASGKMKSEKMLGGSKTLIATFGLLAFGSVIFLLLYYKGDLGADLGEDDNLWVVALVGVCIHTFLLMFTLAFNTACGAFSCTKIFAGEKGDKDCDGVSVHALNEIPIVSALVFTVNIGIVGILVGEALEEDTSVKLLGAVLALLALIEIAGRRMI